MELTTRRTRGGDKVNYFEGGEEERTGAAPVDYQRLSQAITSGNFASLDKAIHPAELTVDLLKAEGFQKPRKVSSASGPARNTLNALGMRLPEDLSPEQIAEAVGPSERLHTIDVTTQQPGPRYTLGEWTRYFRTPAEKRTRLLNVVSLPLAGTALAEEMQAPAAVREVDLVDRVWPAEEDPRPEVLLYALMSPAGSFTDFHIDFGGSSVWYHVVEGSKTFLLVPPTPANCAKYEDWANSEHQASSFFGASAEGCVRCTLDPRETLLIPSGWPHAVVTPTDSLVVGGNFLHGFDLRRQLQVSEMEERLGVALSSRFPLYRPLMWHTAAHYVNILKQSGGSSLTGWEARGLASLANTLAAWYQGARTKGGACSAPESIGDPSGLVRELKAGLEKLPQKGGFLATAAALLMDNGMSSHNSQDNLVGSPSFSGGQNRRKKQDRPKHYPSLAPQLPNSCPDSPAQRSSGGGCGWDACETGFDSWNDLGRSRVGFPMAEDLNASYQDLEPLMVAGHMDMTMVPQPLQYLPEDDDSNLLQDNSGSFLDLFDSGTGGDGSATATGRAGGQIARPASSNSSLSISSDSGSEPNWDSDSESEEVDQEYFAQHSKRRRRESSQGIKKNAKSSKGMSGKGSKRQPLKRLKQIQKETSGKVDVPATPAPANLITLGKSKGRLTYGMGLTKSASGTGLPQASKPAPRPQEQVRLQRLREELRKEEALQARIQRGQIALKDGGARIQARISSLRAQIAAAEAPRLAASSALLGSAHRSGALDPAALVMVPVQNEGEQPGTSASGRAPSENGRALHNGNGQSLQKGQAGGSGGGERSWNSGARGRDAERGRSQSVARSLSREGGGSRDQRRSWHSPQSSGDVRNRSVGLKSNLGRQPHSAAGRPVGRVQSQEQLQREREVREKQAREREQAAREWEERRRKWSILALQEEMLPNGDENDEGLWTFVDRSGKETGPCTIQELCHIFISGEISGSTTVNDEEEGVSMRLDTLLAQPANRAKLNAAKLSHPSSRGPAATLQVSAAPAVDPYSTRHHIHVAAPSAPPQSPPLQASQHQATPAGTDLPAQRPAARLSQEGAFERPKDLAERDKRLGPDLARRAQRPALSNPAEWTPQHVPPQPMYHTDERMPSREQAGAQHSELADDDPDSMHPGDSGGGGFTDYDYTDDGDNFVPEQPPSLCDEFPPPFPPSPLDEPPATPAPAPAPPIAEQDIAPALPESPAEQAQPAEQDQPSQQGDDEQDDVGIPPPPPPPLPPPPLPASADSLPDADSLEAEEYARSREEHPVSLGPHALPSQAVAASAIQNVDYEAAPGHHRWSSLPDVGAVPAAGVPEASHLSAVNERPANGWSGAAHFPPNVSPALGHNAQSAPEFLGKETERQEQDYIEEERWEAPKNGLGGLQTSGLVTLAAEEEVAPPGASAQLDGVITFDSLQQILASVQAKQVQPIGSAFPAVETGHAAGPPGSLRLDERQRPGANAAQEQVVQGFQPSDPEYWGRPQPNHAPLWVSEQPQPSGQPFQSAHQQPWQEALSRQHPGQQQPWTDGKPVWQGPHPGPLPEPQPYAGGFAPQEWTANKPLSGYGPQARHADRQVMQHVRHEVGSAFQEHQFNSQAPFGNVSGPATWQHGVRPQPFHDPGLQRQPNGW